MKRFLAFLLAMTAAASLAACSNGPRSETPTITNTTAPTTEAAQPSSEASEPSSEATEPSTEATEPSTEATEPSSEATEPAPWVPEEGMEYEYLEDGTPVYARRCDDEGNVIEEIHFENGRPFWSGAFVWEDGVYRGTATFYGENGQIIRVITFEDYLETQCVHYIYGEDGALLEERPEELEDRQWMAGREYFVYDGNIVRVYTAESGLSYSAEFDEDGRLLWEEEGCPYGESGEYTNYTTYEYNADGSCTAIFVGGTCGRYYSHYDSNGNLLEYYGDDDPGEDPDPSQCGIWQSNRYNDLGDIISSTDYSFGEPTAEYVYEYQYDSEGRWIEQYYYCDGELLDRYIRSYNDQGFVAEERSESDGYCITFTYNEAGLLAEDRSEFPDGTIRVQTNQYDDTGRQVALLYSYIE